LNLFWVKSVLNNQNNPPATKCRLARAFSLLEVIVAVAIIAILISIITPALTKARRNARQVITMNNQHQITTLLNCFASDNNNRYPESVATIGQLDGHWNWQEPTMLTACRSRGPQFHRSMSAYLHGYVEDANVMFCPNAPHKYKYLSRLWSAGDNWDNPETPPPDDPAFGTYCFYWNYTGFLSEQKGSFNGPQGASGSPRHSKLLVSDYFGFGHWRSPGAFGSCENFPSASVTPGTAVSSDYWSCPRPDPDTGPDTIDIKLHAGYTDGHVETYSASQTAPMWVSITPGGNAPYPDGFGPGTFYLPENALP